MRLLHRLYELAMALVVLAAPGLMLVLFGDLYADLVAMARWERVPCMLGETWINRREDRPWHEIVHGSIHYRYDGAVYASTRLALEPLDFNEPGYAGAFLSRLRDREDLECLVDPGDPRRAVLMVGTSALQTATYWFGFVFTLVTAALGGLLLWRVLSDGPEERPGR